MLCHAFHFAVHCLFSSSFSCANLTARWIHYLTLTCEQNIINDLCYLYFMLCTIFFSFSSFLLCICHIHFYHRMKQSEGGGVVLVLCNRIVFLSNSLKPTLAFLLSFVPYYTSTHTQLSKKVLAVKMENLEWNDYEETQNTGMHVQPNSTLMSNTTQ